MEIMPKKNINLSYITRVMALVLIMAFIVQDMSWAYPDHAPIPRSNANDKLAPLSFFMKERSFDRALAEADRIAAENRGIANEVQPAPRNEFLSVKRRLEWRDMNVAKHRSFVQSTIGYLTKLATRRRDWTEAVELAIVSLETIAGTAPSLDPAALLNMPHELKDAIIAANGIYPDCIGSFLY